MQIFILISLVLFLQLKCYYTQRIVSMEVDSFTPLLNDKIEHFYNTKVDFTNEKERYYLRTRRRGVYPLVEVGPGSFKVEYQKKTPDFLVHKFEKLLELKKKHEAE